MLYKKNVEKELSKNLFENPTSEYRGTPFWAWNCKLDEDMLRRQIGYLQEMGFGGFHMHSRVGMSSEYLGEEFMNMVKACTDEAKKRDMLSWLYDEDKWPSGYAGGLVTKNPKYRKRFITFAHDSFPAPDTMPFKEAVEKGGAYYVASYDIVLNEKGELKSYRKIGERDSAEGDKWNVYCKTTEPTGWFNGLTYVDTLSKEAIDEFIRVTYEAYKNSVGEDFSEAVPAIFTDEPQFNHKDTLKFATSKDEEILLPWTIKLPELFHDYTGEDILDKLPELLWDLPDGKASKFRYKYHDFICELFTVSFSDNCGKWCEENGIMLTGHMMSEDTLMSQTMAIGEAMRAYRGFQLPGIDTLCDEVLLNTAKQAQSASHQYGREGVLSELYGVTNWDFDFRGHKFQGDWEAAMGVTVRVPHLSWVSMAGEAKRDYPASINYQSPWYKEYKYIEDHFSRVNTALTRGKPDVKVGVIHPIESYWLHWGPSENTSSIRKQMSDNFENLINWLLLGTVDFDYICESSLPDIYGGVSNGKFNVGAMGYETIIVPEAETIRKTTLDALKEFKAAGGKVIFAGECPKYVDVEQCDEIKKFYGECVCVAFNKIDILNALSEDRMIEIRNANGHLTDNLIYNMRSDNDCKWLFIAHAKKSYGERLTHARFNDINSPKAQNVVIKIKGEFTPLLYNTLNGKIEEIGYRAENGYTVIKYIINNEDSILLKLNKNEASSFEVEEEAVKNSYDIVLKGKHEYLLDEPNVLLLDKAQFAFDDGEFEEEEEILRLDTICRSRLGIESKNRMPQPWVFDDKDSGHTITLKFTINSEIDVCGAKLAIEDAENHEFVFNGEKITPVIDGYFTDESIKTFTLPTINKGENILCVKLKLSIRSNTEWCYILGDFGVRVEGSEATIVPKTEKVGYSSLKMQAMPFYGGNITYKNEIETPDCDLIIKANYYKGAVIKVFVDGVDTGYIAFAPYKLKIKNVKRGKHKIELKLFGNRLNSFGPVHNTCFSQNWYGPNIWRTEGDEWSYEYQLSDMGIMSAPVVTVIEK